MIVKIPDNMVLLTFVELIIYLIWLMSFGKHSLIWVTNVIKELYSNQKYNNNIALGPRVRVSKPFKQYLGW